MPFNCYWSNSSACLIEINQNENNAFIIASNDLSRAEYVERIKKLLLEFDLNPIFAIDLTGNNNLKAFCDSICSHIRASRLIIIDLSGPILPKCEKCCTEQLQFSVNVFWEYAYAAGLKRPIIVICDEKQINHVPFDVFDKNIQPYNQDSLEEELGSLIKIKIQEYPQVESKVKSNLYECYNGLVKICELYFQKIDKMNNPNFEIALSNDEVFIGVKKIERYKEICFEYLNIYFETEEGSVKRIGRSRFTIICGDLTIEVWLNNGEFPLNMFYFFKKGNRREQMKKNEIFKILENIKERISQI